MRIFNIFPGPVARLAIGIPFAVAAASPVLAKGPDDAVTRTEDARLRAEVAHDMPRLAQLVAADLWYIHANGRAQDKQDYLAAVAKADSPVREARILERSVRVDGRVAVIHGTVDYLVRTDDRPRRARYLAVYRQQKGGWQLSAWQNSPVAESK